VSDAKSCQRKENVFVAENSQSQKTKWKVEFLAYTALVAVNEKQFSLSIALGIKRQFNKAASSYILLQLFVFFILLLDGDTKQDTANEEFSMVCLNRVVLGTAIVRFHYSSFLSLHPTVRICN